MSDVLGMFAKYPRAGRVKTRLSRRIGTEAAAALYAAMLGDLCDRFCTSGDRRVLAYTHAEEDRRNARKYFETLSSGRFELWQQPEGELGARMSAFFAAHRSAPDDRVVLVGTDAVTLPTAFVAEAFERLHDRDCVLAPAADGGYCLLGLRCECPDVFRDIPWSTPDVLAVTVERLSAAQKTLAVLPIWFDVDTTESLAALRGQLTALTYSQQTGPDSFPRTETWLREFFAGRENGPLCEGTDNA